jgi:hypothetical protein
MTINDEGRGPKCLKIWRRYMWRNPYECVNQRTAHTRRSAPTHYTPIDAVGRKDVPFGGLVDIPPITGVIPPKPLNRWQELTFPVFIFLSRYRNDVRSRTHNSSKRSLRRDANTQCLIVRRRVISGVKLAKNRFEGEIPAKLQAFIS